MNGLRSLVIVEDETTGLVCIQDLDVNSHNTLKSKLRTYFLEVLDFPLNKYFK